MAVELHKKGLSTIISSFFKDKSRSAALKEDSVAAFSIALVTIPLSVGIAVASNVPPMAGLFSAIIGGLMTTFFRSSNLTVNGPATSLIYITATAITTLGNGDADLGFCYFLAASVCAGVLLMLLSLLKMGRYGDIFPTAVIYGILGAIGLMILGQQAPVALGTYEATDRPPMENLTNLPELIYQQNLIVGIIGIGCLLILLSYGRLKSRIFKFIPAPLLVILIGIIMAFAFGFQTDQVITLFNNEYPLGPDLLVKMPSSILEQFRFPNFEMMWTFKFWRIVLLITLIVFIETIISARAMDKIDPLGRQTDLNRDLFACGLSTSCVAFLGGLPIITAVPMYYGAKTKWANFFQGVLLIAFVLLIPFVIRWVPSATLAALLIFTGYKLASPKIFKDTYRLGIEQSVVLVVTLIVILYRGVLIGTIVGFAVIILIQRAKSNLKRRRFFNYLWKPDITTKENSETELYIETKGVINFINILALKEAIRKAKGKEQLVLDMSNTRLVDSTVLEYLHEQVEKYEIPSVQFQIIGLDAHETSSRHPNAMHVLPENKKPQLTKRQEALVAIASKHEGDFWPEIRWDVSLFKQFSLFQTRPIDYKLNTAKGNYLLFIEWESCDITFAQGALFNTQFRHSSVLLLHLPFNAPIFVLAKETFKEKLKNQLSTYKDINFSDYPDFSSSFLLTGPNEEEVRAYFNTTLIEFLEANSNYQIESNGSMVLIHKEMRFASPYDMEQLHSFSERLASLLLENWKKEAKKLKSMF